MQPKLAVLPTRESIFDPIGDDVDIELRPSLIHSYEKCSYAAAFEIAGIRTVATPAAIEFGTCIHTCCQEHITGLVSASVLPDRFQALWEEVRQSRILSYSKNETFESLLATGSSLMEQFPTWWQLSGLRPIAVEERLKTTIAPKTVVSCQPDLIAEATVFRFDEFGYPMVTPGDIVLLDWKAPKQRSSDVFARRSTQLTYYYHNANDYVAALGKSVTRVGYGEFLRKKVPIVRGEGPVIAPLNCYSRSEALVRDAISKAIKVADEIRHGDFHRASHMAFNTPCDMCGFAQACLTGDPDDLVLPKGVTEDMIQPK
jgi:hypothetical protein